MKNHIILLITISFVFTFSACKKKETKSETYGSISGIIKSSAGLPIAGASVKISTIGKETVATSSENGTYSVGYLSPQTYQVTASKTGYETGVQNALVVVGETAISDFTLTQQVAFINASLTSITAGNSQGSFTVSITSNVTWTVSTSASWISCSPTSGTDNGIISVNCTENTTSAERVTSIVVSGTGTTGSATRDISFSQLSIPITNDGDHILMGNPSNATTNVSNANNYLMVKPQFIISYNNSTRTANWVSWYLSDIWIGNVDRQDDFRADTDIPSGWYRCDENEYSYSGFDRGHMCPSADRTYTIPDNSATFLMTNMIPQAPDNNQVTWANLENYGRSLVSAGNELYIISGPAGQGGEGDNGLKNTIGNGVVVPSKVWKIIVVLPFGANDLSRVTTSTRVIAVITPNTNSCDLHSWSYYRTSVNAIETLTGFDFLSNVPDNIENVIEAKIDNLPTGM